MTPKAIARILQNRVSNVKAAKVVSALQDTIDNPTGTCFYVHCEDGRVLRVAVTQYAPTEIASLYADERSHK